jgi:hypothetical protein
MLWHCREPNRGHPTRCRRSYWMSHPGRPWMIQWSLSSVSSRSSSQTDDFGSLHQKDGLIICRLLFFLFLGVGWDWVHLVRQPQFDLLYQPQMIDDECGAVGGMRIVGGNRSTRRKPAPGPLYPPQIPHNLTWARNQAAAVGSRRLTAWAMTRTIYRHLLILIWKSISAFQF